MLIIYFFDPSITKNTAHNDTKNKNLDNVHSIKVNSFPTLEEHLTPKIYVDKAISDGAYGPSLLKLDPNGKVKLDEQDSIVLTSTLTSTKTIKELPTKSYVDSLHETNRSRRDLSSVSNDHDKEFNINQLPNLDSVSVKKIPFQIMNR